MVKKPKAYRTGMGKAQPGDANVAEDQVARERAQMLVERQAELDGVLDRHDDMVRVLRFVRTVGLAWETQTCACVGLGPRGVSSRTVCDVARV